MDIKRTVLVMLTLWVLGSPALSADATRSSKPNVLLICIDDLKPLLGCYGAPVVQSPNIDRLAARGLLFQRAYCNQAVCSPSRNALLTGLRPQTLGIYDLDTNFRVAAPSAISLPQHFKQHGYRTQSLGKIFHAGPPNHDDEASWSVPSFVANRRNANRANEAQAQRAQDPMARPRRAAKKGPAYDAADVDDSAYADGKVADEAVRRLQAAKRTPNEPFFLAVGFVKPHLPFVAPKRYWDLYQPSAFELATFRDVPAGAPSYAPHVGGELRRYRGIPAEGALPEELQRTLIHGYHAAASYTDAQIGRVLAALDETGLADNTIIVLWGDHGWHLGDHGIWCKQTNYEQATRIPLMIVAPEITSAGSKTDAFIESVDIYPTLCELAALPPPANVDGSSMVDVLRNPESEGKESVIHVYPRNERMGRAIRTARYRLVEWKVPRAPRDSAELELYDYEADPLETRNIADESPSIVAKLRSILDKHPEARRQVRRTSVAAPQARVPDAPSRAR